MRRSYQFQSIARRAAIWIGSGAGRGFLVGLFLGGAAVALLAPLSGPELRRTLRSKAQTSADAVSEGVSKTADAARSLANDAGTWVDRGKERVMAETSRIASAARTAYTQGSPS